MEQAKAGRSRATQNRPATAANVPRGLSASVKLPRPDAEGQEDWRGAMDRLVKRAGGGPRLGSEQAATVTYRIRRRGRFWEVLDPTDALICVTVYKRGAEEVVRRLCA